MEEKRLLLCGGSVRAQSSVAAQPNLMHSPMPINECIRDLSLLKN
jgi:hypothetical protein